MSKIVIAASDLGVHVEGAKDGALEIGKYFQDKIVLKSDNVIKSKDILDLKKNIIPLNKFNQELYNTLIKIKEFPIVVGGDHAIAMASVLASKKKNDRMGIIWVDAHTDYNTLETTITGNLHGVPLAVINGFNKEELAYFFDGNFISPENTVVIGARSIDDLELQNLRKSHVKVFSVDDIRNMGIENVVKEALKIAGNNTNYIHVSFDLDVVDPKIAPGVSIPEDNGINKEEALKINRLLVQNNKVCSYDLVEYNFLRDKSEKTLDIALELIKEVRNIKD